MKKWLVFSVLAAMAVAAVLVWQAGRESADWRPGMPLAKERVKVGVIHIANIVSGEDFGYTYAHDSGIRAMQRAVGLGDDQIIRKLNVPDTDPAATEYAMRICITEGANIIIATSWDQMDVCESLASEFPGVVFAHATGVKRNATNFTNYAGRMYQARYLAGIVAGLKTASGKIGYVAAKGKENSEVTGGLNAFALGVESVNPQARIYVRTTRRWYDPAGEALAARQLIAEGCDVIAQHTDTPNPQIEAQRAGVWGIGYNSDMRGNAPEAVITSVVWNWGVYYEHLVRSVISGDFTTEPYLGDLASGMVGLAPFNDRLTPPGAAELAAAAQKRIVDGEFHIFEGVMETNDGRLVGLEGERLGDGEIFGGMDWYYRTIIEQ